MQKKILIVGAGPGAVDLITVRGLKALETADFVLYAGSLVNPEHLNICQPSCVKRDSAEIALEEQVSLMAKFALEGKNVVRLHTGDPAMYGAINEQISLLAEHGIGVNIIPGVSSVFGAAAALGCELTAPEISQSVVLTRTPGRTPMPNKEKASSFAQTGATLVFFLSTGKLTELTKELCDEGGLAKETPAAVVYRATWPEERILRGTLEDIAMKVEDAGFGRQALIFVGKALDVANVNAQKLNAVSKLYAKGFSHGYRNTLASERFKGSCAMYVFSQQGIAKAKEIAQGLKLPVQIYSAVEDNQAILNGTPDAPYSIEYVGKGKMPTLLKNHWNSFDAHIFIGAAGIAVRYIAPLLQSKLYDPAVLCCSDSGSHVMSLVAGHIGGANRLSRRIARITGGQAVISTATDIHTLPSFDEVVMAQDARIINPDSIKHLNAALLAQNPIAFFGDEEIYKAYFTGTCVVYKGVNSCSDMAEEFAICWDIGIVPTIQDMHVMYVDSKALVLGIGCRKDVDQQTLKEAFGEFIKTHDIEERSILKIASCTLKSEEKAILQLAKDLNIAIEFHDESVLANIPTPNPSSKVLEKVGTCSVSEAAALCSAGYPVVKRPYIVKTAYASSITFSVARIPHGDISLHSQDEEKLCGEMVVVGLGSGSYEHITPEVIYALKACDVVAGYTPYVDFIRYLVADKDIIQNGMMGEMARCVAAMEMAAQGEKVCMVCSGDPGILAMAGLLMELRHERDEFTNIPIRVLPGITSANIAAASLGAPLQNGFCLVSLSDLLVPTEEVRMNLQSVAKSELPVTLYNPAGKKRRELMAEALQIFIDARGKDTLCAYVKHAGREMETKWIGTLADFPQDEVDMSTLLIIGGKRTKYDGEYLYESRGYIDKYCNE